MVKAWFDGACIPNPGRGGWGFVVRDDAGKLLGSGNGCLGEGSTNNAAELRALVEVLLWLKARPELRPAVIHGDSQWAIGAAMGFKIKKPHLIPLSIAAKALVKETDVRLRWVPREENSEADAESLAALQ